VYYVTDVGKAPVEEFIDGPHVRTRQKFFNVVHLLEEFGKRLPEPHAKYIGDEIYESRFSGIEGNVRILYFFFVDDKAVLTNGFVKKTSKVPVKEKEKAVERRKIYLERHQ